jgi:hypothetical protein
MAVTNTGISERPWDGLAFSGPFVGLGAGSVLGAPRCIRRERFRRHLPPDVANLLARLMSRVHLAAWAGLACALALANTSAGATSYTVLYSFGAHGGDGAFPEGPLIFDSKGNLYGTTLEGEAGCPLSKTLGCGAVFELSPPAIPGGT